MLYLLATPALALRPTAAHPAAVVRMPASRLAVQPTMVATTPEEKALLAASRCAAPAIPKDIPTLLIPEDLVPYPLDFPTLVTLALE